MLAVTVKSLKKNLPVISNADLYKSEQIVLYKLAFLACNYVQRGVMQSKQIVTFYFIFDRSSKNSAAVVVAWLLQSSLNLQLLLVSCMLSWAFQWAISLSVVLHIGIFWMLLVNPMEIHNFLLGLVVVNTLVIVVAFIRVAWTINFEVIGSWKWNCFRHWFINQLE